MQLELSHSMNPFDDDEIDRDPEESRTFWYAQLWDKIEVALECATNTDAGYVTLNRAEFNAMNAYFDAGGRGPYGHLPDLVQRVIRDAHRAANRTFKEPSGSESLDLRTPQEIWAQF